MLHSEAVHTNQQRHLLVAKVERLKMVIALTGIGMTDITLPVTLKPLALSIKTSSAFLGE
jgi:hypothetical protein